MYSTVFVVLVYILHAIVVLSELDCTWTDSSTGITLDLTQLSNSVLKGFPDYPEYEFFYTPCRNNAECHGENVMTIEQSQNPDPDCYIIGRWDQSYQPDYYKDSGVDHWRFEYVNGADDCGAPVRIWAPTFVCDPDVDVVMSNVTENPNKFCQYEAEIRTKYACQNVAFTGLELMTDEYPRESWWLLKTPSGILVDSRSNGYYTISSHKYMTPFPPLIEGQEYVFTIMDTACDGICCEYGDGYYNLWVNDIMIYEGNGDFGCNANTTFNTTYGPGDECSWKFGDNTLNLTVVKGFTLNKVSDNDQSQIYSLSPCSNNINCNGESSMITLGTISNCIQRVAKWDQGVTQPSHSNNFGGQWEFVYTNGDNCNNGPGSVVAVFWNCNPFAGTASITGAKEIGLCHFEIQIDSNLACS